MNKLTTSLFVVGFAALPFCGGCDVSEPDAEVDQNLTGIKLPNTTFAKYSAVFSIPEDLKTPTVGKTTAVLVGGVKGDKVAVGVTCFNLDKGSVSVSLVKIATNGKTSTALSTGTLTALKDTKSFTSHIVATGDRLAVLAKTSDALPNGVSCTVAVDGLSNGVTTQLVGDMKHAYDTLTASDTDTDTPDFKAVDSSTLKGLAKRQFNFLTSTWGEDYPPASYQWSAAGQTIIVVTEDNDGGGSRDFYTTDGRWITSGSYSESESFSW
jgi:hypothetical protein